MMHEDVAAISIMDMEEKRVIKTGRGKEAADWIGKDFT